MKKLKLFLKMKEILPVKNILQAMQKTVGLWIAVFFLTGLYAPSLAADEYAEARQQLVKIIAADVKATSLYLDKETLDPRVMVAIGKVPRDQFVPDDEKASAYENRPLPIGYGQTISQPYIVAIMTDLLKVTVESKVLEIGTGSGYQAAILSGLVDKLYTIEIIKPLGEQAKVRLARLGYNNVQVKIGDGYYGWEEHAPFDAIIVTAAGSHIPPALIKQLKVGGVMIIPVGSRFLTQQLLLIKKEAEDKVTTQQILPVKFVPLTGKH
jgi:protein-L-isoaspartate(D-aspartate) O-methyltransferase